MQIEQKILDKWKELKSSGDVKKLVLLCGTSKTTISIALNAGNCSDEHFEKIATFYNNKMAKIKSLA